MAAPTRFRASHSWVTVRTDGNGYCARRARDPGPGKGGHRRRPGIRVDHHRGVAGSNPKPHGQQIRRGEVNILCYSAAPPGNESNERGEEKAANTKEWARGGTKVHHGRPTRACRSASGMPWPNSGLSTTSGGQSCSLQCFPRYDHSAISLGSTGGVDQV